MFAGLNWSTTETLSTGRLEMLREDLIRDRGEVRNNTAELAAYGKAISQVTREIGDRRTDSEASITYDVTAVSHDGQRVPLTAGTDYSTAHDIARPRSMDEAWAAVQVKVASTGEVIATYVDGADSDGRPV